MEVKHGGEMRIENSFAPKSEPSHPFQGQMNAFAVGFDQVYLRQSEKAFYPVKCFGLGEGRTKTSCVCRDVQKLGDDERGNGKQLAAAALCPE